MKITKVSGKDKKIYTGGKIATSLLPSLTPSLPPPGDLFNRRLHPSFGTKERSDSGKIWYTRDSQSLVSWSSSVVRTGDREFIGRTRRNLWGSCVLKWGSCSVLKWGFLSGPTTPPPVTGVRSKQWVWDLVNYHIKDPSRVTDTHLSPGPLLQSPHSSRLHPTLGKERPSKCPVNM